MIQNLQMLTCPRYAYNRIAELWAEEQDDDYNPEIDNDANDDDAYDDEPILMDDDQPIDLDAELRNLQQHEAPILEPTPNKDDTMQTKQMK